MKNPQFLYAACAVAMMAAGPVYAQTNTQAESTGPNNTVNAPASSKATASSSSATAGSGKTSDSMAPKADMSSGDTMHAVKSDGVMRHSAAASHSMMRASKSDTSQDAAVDRLNEQSFEAAQKGQAFTAGASTSGSDGAMGGGGQTDSAGHSKM